MVSERNCASSEVDATCAAKQKVPKGGDATGNEVDVGPCATVSFKAVNPQEA